MKTIVKEQKQRLLSLLDRWREPLGLTGWRITLVYDTDGLATEATAGSDVSECVAKCHVDWPYYEATVEFDVRETAEMDDERLEEIFVHELMHILLKETREWADGEALHHEERVATLFTRAFLRVRHGVG